MKTVFFFFLSLLYTYGFSQNLILNGNAELGDISSWTANSNSIGASMQEWQPNNTVYPQEGDFFFTFHNEQAQNVILSQKGTLDNPLEELNLSGYFHGEYWANIDLDFGEVVLSIFDSNNLLINRASSGNLVPEDPSTWIDFSLKLPVDSNSYTWKVELKGTRLAGSHINVYYDNIILTNTISVSSNDVPIYENPNLYPNPFSNLLYIDKKFTDLNSVRIYSINGNEILNVKYDNNNVMDLSHLPSGNYLIIGYNSNNEIEFTENIIKK